MTLVENLLQRVRASGGRVRVEDSRLHLTSPRPLPDSLLAALQVHKPAVLAHLAQIARPVAESCTADPLPVEADPSGHVVLDAEGLPCRPCGRCGGRKFWRLPADVEAYAPWHCRTCVPQPRIACDGCAVPERADGPVSHEAPPN